MLNLTIALIADGMGLTSQPVKAETVAMMILSRTLCGVFIPLVSMQ